MRLHLRLLSWSIKSTFGSVCVRDCGCAVVVAVVVVVVVDDIAAVEPNGCSNGVVVAVFMGNSKVILATLDNSVVSSRNVHAPCAELPTEVGRAIGRRSLTIASTTLNPAL